MRFDNAFCTNSTCSPARATLLTGTYSHINGMTTLEQPGQLGDAAVVVAVEGRAHGAERAARGVHRPQGLRPAPRRRAPPPDTESPSSCEEPRSGVRGCPA
ncbi:sulfatase-like hydrolase/transferase [Streptomyces sp. NBC_01717]